MRIALAQINTTVGDFSGNLLKIKGGLRRAREEKADLVVFPEQTIPGYPAEDLLERQDFLRAIDSTFEEAVAACHDVAMVIGTTRRVSGSGGNPIHNSAVLVADRRIVGVQHKTLLPTYDVFDEARYFRPSETCGHWTLAGRNMGLAICEDLWNDPRFWAERRYPNDPVERL